MHLSLSLSLSYLNLGESVRDAVRGHESAVRVVELPLEFVGHDVRQLGKGDGQCFVRYRRTCIIGARQKRGADNHLW